MPPVAPLPFWPINGQEFDPAHHLHRVLAVFGCHDSCPCFPTARHHEYVSGAFANVRDSTTGLQHSVPEIHVLVARSDDWLYREHDHAVDPDLVFRYPRLHSFPFQFSRPIAIGSPTDDDAEVVTHLHVADIHLRWSEIARGVQDSSYTPSRYPLEAYPFDRAYFRSICAQFHPLLYAAPSEFRLAHSETGLLVARSSYRPLMSRIASFDAAHPPQQESDPSWYLLRVPMATFIHEFQLYTERWWPDITVAVRHFRLLAAANWLDEQRSSPADSPAAMRRTILDAALLLTDWEPDTDDKDWGWWLGGF